jgi:protein-S-isoprenylcysteine O-methyltransferase Ste14
LRWVLAAATGWVLIVLSVGVVRSHRRPSGRASGAAQQVLKLRTEALIGVGFFGACIVLWRPLPLEPHGIIRSALDVVGAVLMVGGLGLTVWGRMTLGLLYGVSSAAGARLHADHRLIVHGPFSHVRHPMYLGIEMASTGGLLLYRTWTTVFLTVSFLGLVMRARREDELLRLEFGDQWEAYRQRVPGWLPRMRRRTRHRRN